MNIAKIIEFKTKPLFNQRTKTWYREIKAEKNIEYLNRAVVVNHLLHCKDLKEIQKFEIGDDIILADGFYHNGNFTYAEMVYRPDFGE